MGNLFYYWSILPRHNLGILPWIFEPFVVVGLLLGHINIEDHHSLIVASIVVFTILHYGQYDSYVPKGEKTFFPL
jgi:hypothetical protein